MFLFFLTTTPYDICGILFPLPGIKPMHPALEAQSPNRWTTREVQEVIVLSNAQKPTQRVKENKPGDMFQTKEQDNYLET